MPDSTTPAPDPADELAFAGLDLLAAHMAATLATLNGHVDGLAITEGSADLYAALEALDVAVPRLQAAVTALGVEVAGPAPMPAHRPQGTRPARPDELCTCGRPAVYVYETADHGDVPYCGVTR